MEDSIIPRKRSHTIGWIAGFTASILIAATGVATAAIRYDARHRGTVLPGVEVGGIKIGGLTHDQARAALRDAFESPLTAPITVEVAGDSYLVKPKDLGMKVDVAESFSHVVALEGRSDLVQRVWFRLAGDGFDKTIPVNRSIDRKKLDAYVEELAAVVDASPVEARVELVDGALRIVKDRPGFKLDREAAAGSLMKAAMSGDVRVALDGEVTAPKVASKDIRDVIVVKVGENKLFHYRGDQVVKVYDVATGLPQYPTPKGTFKIVNKRFRPTWVNPAKYPGGWGANLPAKIGPGPGNPLGTRAMDINSPGIRIHGSPAAYSMGYNASHGCIRMRMPDVEELFALVEVGTPVIIVQTAPARLMPARLRAQDRNTIDPNGPTTAPQQGNSPSPGPTTSPSPDPLSIPDPD